MSSVLLSQLYWFLIQAAHQHKCSHGNDVTVTDKLILMSYWQKESREHTRLTCGGSFSVSKCQCVASPHQPAVRSSVQSARWWCHWRAGQVEPTSGNLWKGSSTRSPPTQPTTQSPLQLDGERQTRRCYKVYTNFIAISPNSCWDTTFKSTYINKCGLDQHECFLTAYRKNWWPWSITVTLLIYVLKYEDFLCFTI